MHRARLALERQSLLHAAAPVVSGSSVQLRPALSENQCLELGTRKKAEVTIGNTFITRPAAAQCTKPFHIDPGFLLTTISLLSTLYGVANTGLFPGANYVKIQQRLPNIQID